MLLFFFLEKKKAWWYINFAYNMHSPLNSQHCFIGKQMSVWNISSLHTHRHISSKFCFGAECKSKNKTKLKQTKSKNKSKKKTPTNSKIYPNRWTYPKSGTSPMWTELKSSVWGQELKLHSGNANLHSRHLTSTLTCWPWQEWKSLPSTHAQNV